MIQWLLSLPKALFVFLVLTIGVIFIVLSDPPHSVCDSQIDNFHDVTKDFLSRDPKSVNKTESRYQKLIETCKATNSPGGCYELFIEIKKMLVSVRAVSRECFPKLTGDADLTAALYPSLDLMVQLAWGGQPPSITGKVGWFDSADINLYCQMRNLATDLNGQEKWNQFVEGYFQSLPGANKLDRNDAWTRMMNSVNCQSYL